jgi:hypothetical protein
MLNMDQKIACELFTSYEASVDRCMAAGGAAGLLLDGRPVMLKPNLINASPHPVTTPPDFCAAVIAFVRRHADAPIVIAEGCGAASLETPEVFAQLGYKALAKELDVGLADHHLRGSCCQPPVNRILSGRDARSLDRDAARLLGMDWHRVGYLGAPEVVGLWMPPASAAMGFRQTAARASRRLTPLNRAGPPTHCTRRCTEIHSGCSLCTGADHSSYIETHAVARFSCPKRAPGFADLPTV